MLIHALRTGWLKARIAYHRRQADACSKPVPRGSGRDRYTLWLRNQALRHSIKARDLQRRLLLAGG